MKRNLCIISVFLAICIMLVCLGGCGGENEGCGVTVNKFSCNMCESDNCVIFGCAEQYGITADFSCLECVWYPCYHGFGDNGEYDTCVLFGFDMCALGAFTPYIPNEDVLPVVIEEREAIEGINYVIEEVKYSISGDYLLDYEEASSINELIESPGVKKVKDADLKENLGALDRTADYEFKIELKAKAITQISSVKTSIIVTFGNSSYRYESKELVDVLAGEEAVITITEDWDFLDISRLSSAGKLICEAKIEYVSTGE